jgi:prevent-host-death family protein
MQKETEEMSVRDTRASFADVVNAAVRGRITYITSRGRRVAAVVPVAVAEDAEIAVAAREADDA